MSFAYARRGFARRGLATALLIGNVVAGPLALLQPQVTFASEVEVPSAAAIESCRAEELELYRETVAQALGDFGATVRAQWDRQVGFRTRAATEARRSTVARALDTAWRRQGTDLTRRLNAYQTRALSDMGRLAEIMRTTSGEAQEAALERWSEARLPSDATVRTSVAAMERTLRLYANTRDRGVIRSVWADMTKQAFAQLTDDLTTARGSVALGFITCAEPEIPTDDEDASSAGTDISGTSAAGDTSSGFTDSWPPTDDAVSSAARTPAPAPTAPAADRVTRPVTPTTSSADRRTAPTPVAPPRAPSTAADDSIAAQPEASITRVELSSATEAVMLEPCVANVVLRGQIRGRAGASVGGYFMFGDGTVSPIYTVRLDSAGSGVMTHAQNQALSRSSAERAISGVAKLVTFSDDVKLESNRATYRFACDSSSAANVPPPNSSVAPTTPSGYPLPNTTAPVPPADPNQTSSQYPNGNTSQSPYLPGTAPTNPTTQTPGTGATSPSAADAAAAASSHALAQPRIQSVETRASATILSGDVCRAELALTAIVQATPNKQITGKFVFDNGSTTEVLSASTDASGKAEFRLNVRRSALSGNEVAGKVWFSAQITGMEMDSLSASFYVSCNTEVAAANTPPLTVAQQEANRAAPANNGAETVNSPEAQNVPVPNGEAVTVSARVSDQVLYKCGTETGTFRFSGAISPVQPGKVLNVGYYWERNDHVRSDMQYVTVGRYGETAVEPFAYDTWSPMSEEFRLVVESGGSSYSTEWISIRRVESCNGVALGGLVDTGKK